MATGPTVDKSINANVVLVDDAYIVQSGKITEINKTDFFIKVTSQDKEEYTLDIEAGTKQNMINPKTLEIEKIGFSKIKEGDVVHFAAKKIHRIKIRRIVLLLKNTRHPPGILL